MRDRLKRRLWAKDGDPGPVAWCVAAVSLVLPVAGLGLCLFGGAQIMRGDADGWLILGLGAGCLVADLVIDLVWAHPGVSESDQPGLNQRGLQFTGRSAVVVEPIVAGRGKIRVADSVWVASGPDLPAGTPVMIVGADGTVLVVAPALPSVPTASPNAAPDRASHS